MSSTPPPKPEPVLQAPTAPPSSPPTPRKGKGGRKAANAHLTNEERRRERVLKNRESAMKSLQKKKRYTEDLEHRALLLSKRNAELKEKIRLLVTRLNSHVPAPVPPHPPFPVAAPAAHPFPHGPALAPSAAHKGVAPPHAAAAATPPPLQAAAAPPPAPPSFSPIDDWVPALSDPFMSGDAPALSLPLSAAQQSGPPPVYAGAGGGGEGDALLGLGLALEMGSAHQSQSASIQEEEGLAGLESHRMTCSQ